MRDSPTWARFLATCFEALALGSLPMGVGCGDAGCGIGCWASRVACCTTGSVSVRGGDSNRGCNGAGWRVSRML